jgi:anti-sigma regulatory factor (Ser/Thr protein kinase)
MTAWLILSNRLENRKVVIDYVRTWARDRGLSHNRLHSLEKVTEEIFCHLVPQAWQPNKPNTIAISLEERGPRLRLMFEDDAAFHNPGSFIPPELAPADCTLYNRLEKLAESLVYYRTAESKNRLAIFLA